MKPIIKAALVVAQKYPVFPTDKKMPCWSNKELKVKKGAGGYKIATQNPARVRVLFSHDRANEIAVPMGEMSGLMCIDVDTYKTPELVDWIKENWDYLGTTRWHRTRSGGYHFIFNHPGNTIRFPATLREGVDIKAVGNGYICFPPTEGYVVEGDQDITDFPLEMLKEAMIAKGGTGRLTVDSYNDATDDEVIIAIQKAEALYPALRTLSYRMSTRRTDRDQQIQVLTDILNTSVAADPSHPRHDDWLDRLSKVTDLVDSGLEKVQRPIMDENSAMLLAAGGSFIDREKMTRPIGPQRETTTSDIEERVAEHQQKKEQTTKSEPSENEGNGEFLSVNAKQLTDATLEPIKWVVPRMIPEGGTVSLAGTSNVGKTRWLAALAALGACGQLDRMGLPKADKFSMLWAANEERTLDIARRIKAVVLQHHIKKSDNILIRGKDIGMLRLVAVNETGNPEIDEANVAKLVAEIRKAKCKVVVFDPYVTLSDAMDENSATSAAVLTKAFILISSMTGAAVIHAHHTPKDRTKEADWYRGDSGAWRGSGAIYSALDCGYTLSHWMPKGKDPRKAWKENYIDRKLGQWIVLDTGKIREGEPLDTVVYELVGQEMAAGEGDEIGVCRLSDETEANNVLLGEAVAGIATNLVAQALFNTFGVGRYTSMAKVFKTIDGHKDWPFSDNAKTDKVTKLYELMQSPVMVEGGKVILLKKGKGTRYAWELVIE